MMVACALLFTISCDKDEKKELDSVESLKGTEWQAQSEISEMGLTITVTMDIELRSDMTFSFGGSIDTGDFEVPGLEEDMFGESLEGEWRYESPKVYMVANGETVVGTISGDTMTIANDGVEDIYDGDIVFQKM